MNLKRGGDYVRKIEKNIAFTNKNKLRKIKKNLGKLLEIEN